MPKEIHSEGDGDLSKRLVVASQDEIGKMAIYFNQFIEKLGGIIRKITDTASSVATSATELLRLLQDWLVKHIKKMDKEYGPYLS